MTNTKPRRPACTTPTDQRPTCCECHGHNVETTAWIEYQTDGTAAIVNGEGPFGDEYGNWCHDCQEHVELNYPATTPADDARRQAANAAREAGPELLDALRALVNVAGDLSDDRPVVARAYREALSLLERLDRRAGIA